MDTGPSTSSGRTAIFRAVRGELVESLEAIAFILKCAIKNSFYPLKRSSKRGIELEGAVISVVDDKQVAFLTSERGNFLLAYDISSIRMPILLGVVPTGKNPEGLVVIPSRNLVLTANEGDGTIDIIKIKP